MPARHELGAWDHAYLWHPFTQMRDWLAQDPLIIERGEGNYLIDVDGRRYFDGVSSLWCNVHGHRHPDLDAALHAQVDRIAHSTLLGLANVPSMELAKALIAVAPRGLTRVFYSDAGATAVEIALKMAIQYWHLRGEPQRQRFVSLTDAYHGDTLGAVSVGYSETFHRFFRPLLFEAVKLDPPHVFRWQRGLEPGGALAAAIEQAERVFGECGRELAAAIVEPLMQGAAGMWDHPPEYLQALHALTKRAGALLICDEVATGFGRTGRMFAVEHAGICPDLLCLGKGLTGGYLPMSATVAAGHVYDAFLGPDLSEFTLYHGHSYSGNALAAAVALRHLELFEEWDVVANVKARSAQLSELLTERLGAHAAVKEIRLRGLMGGVELAPPADGLRWGRRVCAAAVARGVLLRPLGDVVVLMPMLTSTAAEIERVVDVLGQAIDEVCG
jgi:adenosylmethionine-8-amino-7-oxononanoate aminotransferase